MFLEYFETITLAVILCSVFFGGIVKGSVGIGMSMFSVPLIAFILPPTKAMMLLCFPVIVTNFIQMDIKRGISNSRFFPMFITLFLGILIGGKLILSLNLKTISIIIALTIIIFTSFNFLGLNLNWLKPKYEKIISIFIGFFSGIFGGGVYVLCTTYNYFFSFIKFSKREFYKNYSNNVFFSFYTIIFIPHFSWFRKFL